MIYDLIVNPLIASAVPRLNNVALPSVTNAVTNLIAGQPHSMSVPNAQAVAPGQHPVPPIRWSIVR